MSLPWVPGAIRALLLTDPVFSAIPGRVVFDSPPDVTTPYVVIQAPGGFSLSGDGVAWSPLIQVDSYCAITYPDARKQVWHLVAEAARILGRARNISFETMSYSVQRIVDGPLEDVDISRGTANPLRRALIRATLAVHTT